MVFIMKDQTSSSLTQYFQMASSFAITRLAILSVRHPVHLVQINKQANPNLSIVEIIRNIYQTSGIKGFYRATPIAISKVIIAESYRGLLMLEVPKFVRQQSSLTGVSNTALSTIGISLIDTIITCPSSRIYTQQIANNQTFTAVIKENSKTNLLKECYKGFSPLFCTISMQWGLFFTIDDTVRLFFSSKFGNNIYSATATALTGGAIQAGINSIPDTIRVYMQKGECKNQGMLSVAKTIVQNHGVKALFAGFQLKLVNRGIGFAYCSILRTYWENKNTVNLIKPSQVYNEQPKIQQAYPWTKRTLNHFRQEMSLA